MSFSPSLARAGRKHLASYGSVLDRFMLSNSSAVSAASTSSSSSTTTSTSTSSAAASVFEATKSASSGCWAPPKYSLRRQAALVKEAALTGQLSSLPDGPKVARMQTRLARLAQSQAAHQQAAEYAYVPQLSAASPARPTALGQRVVKPTQRTPSQEHEAALNTARRLVKDVGPYAGRARAFKGSRVDKNKFVRKAAVDAKLESMHNTVHDWHSSQTEAKNKLKPGLPF